ncbi:amino acid adenylation domain-containing protein [Pseudomonas congelans]|uniref:non-ribosomal peptide synthetase n=1 Tax=Pseudomonas congelans TaxID=200452 RepID=UPI001F26628C|nr:amino acid adenylation domain-containing protein [Pseudomonas congelans]MCF5162959.1 amino acid adenylation domain-containing protein [Pseudomonas congelans]
MIANLPHVYRFCATTAQRRLWQLHQQDPRSAAGQCTSVMRLQGALHQQELALGLAIIVQRHEALRTCFSWEDGELVQWVHAGMQIPLTYVDLSSSAHQAFNQGMQLASEDAAEPFDLRNGPLLRPRLIRLSKDDHLLVLSAHPIIADRFSISILYEEWSQAYRGVAPMPELPVQFADFSVWEAERRRSTAVGALLSSTREDFKHRPWTPELPRVANSNSCNQRQGRCVKWLAEHLAPEHIVRLAASRQTTVDVALAAAFNVLLYRYSQQNEVCLGLSARNRRHADTQGVIGCFANTLPMRTVMPDGISLEQVLDLTRDAWLHAESTPDVDLEHLIYAPSQITDEVALPVLFEMRAPLLSPAFEGLDIQALAVDAQVTDCDLKLVVYSGQTSIQGHFEFDANQFDVGTVERMARHFEALLMALVQLPQIAIEQVQLAPLYCASLSLSRDDTVFTEAQRRPVHQRFEEQVQKAPERTALIFERQAWSYAALNCQANQLAWHLHARGVGPGTVVALLVERGPRLISSLLAILKAGAAYLPLDSMYPAQRIASMFEDAGIAMIISCDALRHQLPDSVLATVCLDQDQALIARQPVANPDLAVGCSELAYCLFTSGSTGRPKGVQIEHRALSNLLAAMQVAPGLLPSDVWLGVTSAAFDIFAVEAYLPLITGATLVLATKDDAADPLALASLACEHRATVLQATPATWRMLIDSEVHLSLRTAMSGGEAMDQALANGMRTLARDVWNLYGPTETTIYSSRASIVAGQVPTLGGPVENTRLYVLDRHLNPVPLGCTGEIYIAGEGLARGYINRPDLTAERFLPDPFGPAGSRMYQTGDLGQQLENGNLVYLDRIDFQVKIRGLRIELGEIEAALRCSVLVRQAIVTAHGEDPANRKLVAYVVGRPGQTPSREMLELELQQTVPGYMVPGIWIFLEQLPLNVSGKIDRSRLPLPTRSAMADESTPIAVQTPTQKCLAGIWAQILQVERVSLHDNFFALGGNSMLAIRCLVRINREFDKQLSLRTFFEHQTVEAMARHLETQPCIPSDEEVRMTYWFDQRELPHVFGFSGCGMHGVGYFQLAQELAPSCNFHAVEPFEAAEDDVPPQTVQEMARRYTQAILARAVNGPITLVGHSFGGSIALETARLLEQQSQNVHLILLDATLIDPRTLEAQAGLRASPDMLPQWLDLPPLSPDDGHPPRNELLLSARKLYLQHWRVFATYVPDGGAVRGPVSVFLAKEAILQKKMLPAFLQVCQQLMFQPPLLHVVPGDHMSMLNAPHVKVLAARIRDQLQQPASALTSRPDVGAPAFGDT